MNKEREIAGIKVFVSNETYNEYKGTLQDQINELQNRIDKATEYMNNYIELEKSIMCESAREEFKMIINILQGKEK